MHIRQPDHYGRDLGLAAQMQYHLRETQDIERFGQWLGSDSVPSFVYLTLPNDHTNGVTPGKPTPKALIADNDLALGQLVQLISHSPIWAHSAIFVVEDDSQDGADHVDAHRMPSFVISPYARHGAVVSTRYDQFSVVRTIEQQSPIQLAAIGIGHDVSRVYTNATKIAKIDQLGPALTAKLIGLLSSSPNAN